MKKLMIITLLILAVLLSGCRSDVDYEEEIVLVDQPKEEPRF